MIRSLGEADRRHLAALLSQSPAHNLYQQGNLAALGFNHPVCTFWGDFGEEGDLRGCANRYMSGWSVYGLATADWAGLAALVDADAGATRLQDNPGGVASLVPYLKRTVYISHEEELMQLAEPDFRRARPPAMVEVRRARLEDLESLVALYADAGEMARSAKAVERPLRDCTVFLLSARDVGSAGRSVVAAALTNAEAENAAMIGGVYTRPEARGRGYSQAVCSALCEQLLTRGLLPCLYWKAPAAGHIYRKLGFRPVGTWRSVWLTPPPAQ